MRAKVCELAASVEYRDPGGQLECEPRLHRRPEGLLDLVRDQGELLRLPLGELRESLIAGA